VILVTQIALETSFCRPTQDPIEKSNVNIPLKLIVNRENMDVIKPLDLTPPNDRAPQGNQAA
jgi:hypothetical protein